MTETIDAAALKHALNTADEIALLDVREAGEHTSGHPFLASSAPLSCFESHLTTLVPRKTCPVVLFDEGSSQRAKKAAALAQGLGYINISILEGGTQAWSTSGYTLYEGVYVPSKTFGELVEEIMHVPHISAQDVQARMDANEDFVLVDGRPMTEHTKMNIPGSFCVPNADLAYFTKEFIPNDEIPVIVHCAGRTRSIIGAQILRDAGVKNPVIALENGTQGWHLAGLELETGSTRKVDTKPDAKTRDEMTITAREITKEHGINFAQASDVNNWAKDTARTTYVFDVRSESEFAAGHLPGTRNTPGGQLIQSTDAWAATRGARIVLVDDNEMRAVIVARYLKLMGWEVFALSGGEAVWSEVSLDPQTPYLPPSPPAAKTKLNGNETILDTRSSMAFREGHLSSAQWTLRATLSEVMENISPTQEIVLCSADDQICGFIAEDLKNMGYSNLSILAGDPKSWQAQGLEVISSPESPSNEEAIDFVFFTHDRHSGNLDAARRYIEWETGLVAQLDTQERAIFKL